MFVSNWAGSPESPAARQNAARSNVWSKCEQFRAVPFRWRRCRSFSGPITLVVVISVLGALAICPHCWHYESMAIQINIRDVPEKVRDELAARAALQGKSMQEFLRAELERLAARPSIDAWLQQVRKRKRATQTRISSRQILENRNADRR
jgi:plasmid stability protein